MLGGIVFLLGLQALVEGQEREGKFWCLLFTSEHEFLLLQCPDECWGLG